MSSLEALEERLQSAISAAWGDFLNRTQELGGSVTLSSARFTCDAHTNHRASAPFARADAAAAITAIFNGRLEELLQRPSGQPFSLLPVETITEILGWLPVKDRVAASSTCKDWHTAAFSAPEIWAEIT